MNRGEIDGYQMDKRYLKPDGSVAWVSLSVVPTRPGQGAGPMHLAMVEDITERVSVSDELKQLNTQLEDRVQHRTALLQQANRELESFSYSVSHDLRAPLRAIDGFTTLLGDRIEGSLDGESRRYLEVIRSSTRNMGELIDNLLALSRIGKQDMTSSRVAMDALARSVYSDLADQYPDRDIRFEINGVPPACADKGMVRIVLDNILSNALKYTGQEPTAYIEFGGSSDGETSSYYVRDNGVGFDMAYEQKLFGAFQRLHAKNEFEGTGVGLAIVERVVKRHGGRVWAEGEMGQGSTFYFTLPSWTS